MTLEEAMSAMKKEGVLPEDATHLDLLDKLDDENKGVIRLKPAIKDQKTGTLYIGQDGEHHNDIAAKIEDPKVREMASKVHDDPENKNGGFVDSSGKFITRSESMKQYGISHSEELYALNAKAKESVDSKLTSEGLSKATTDEALLASKAHIELLARELRTAKDEHTLKWPGAVAP